MRGAQGAELLVLVLHVEERAERADHELHALVDRRLAQVADPEVDEVADALLLRQGARHREHPLREVDADHRASRPAAIGTAIRPDPTASSTTGPSQRRASST